MPDINQLIDYYQSHTVFVSLTISFVAFVIFSVMYLRSQPEKTKWRKAGEIFMLVFYTALFGVFVLVGLEIGNEMNSPGIGVCIGLVAFWLLSQIIAWVKKKRMKV